jgi:hypothetical protein
VQQTVNSVALSGTTAPDVPALPFGAHEPVVATLAVRPAMRLPEKMHPVFAITVPPEEQFGLRYAVAVSVHALTDAALHPHVPFVHARVSVIRE